MSSPHTPFLSVDEFVSQSSGNRVIKKILVANNGIGARKAILSLRRWSFEIFNNDRMIQIAVMASPEDMKANAGCIYFVLFYCYL